jgi:phenylalanyl-tRNA synthetase beta chain
MNVSLQWLRALAPDLAHLSPEQLADRLTHLGYPVEGMDVLSQGLGDIVVAKVLSVRPHPNADRLRVCEVDGGSGTVQVVCGAPNVEAGGWYPLAPVGATLPGGMTIRKARLRGEASEGMLCSEVELGLGRGKDGLMTLDLPEGSERARPGLPLVEALGLDDVRLNVEITSNRPDLLSHRGLAREASAGGHGGLVEPPVPAGTPGELAGIPVVRHEGAPGARVAIQDPERCPRYLGLVIRGVRVGPSPAWLQDRLRAAGARPINNVVDATNWVLLERGQPLHAFDLDRLSEGRIVVRRATEGEPLRTLDGVERTLSSEMLAICDAAGPVAVAGVMGGESSEVTESTTDLFLECALFTPGPIRATRKALELSTDASYRFERGVDPEGLLPALLRCVELVLATAGGRVEGPVEDAAPAGVQELRGEPPRILELRPRAVERLLGIPFEEEALRDLLVPLGFQVENGADGGEGETPPLRVRVPGWRWWDVSREVDLIEEVARRHGYDRFPDTLAPYRPGSVPDDPRFQLEDRIRDFLVGRGMLEAQTPAFAPRGEGRVEVLNPVSMEERWLRGDLLPALLRRVEYNLARGNRDVRLFEIGTVFGDPPAPGALPRESTRLALVLHGNLAPAHWTGAPVPVDAWEVKGLLEALGRLLAPGQGSTVAPAAHPGPRVLRGPLALQAGETTLGHGGAVDPGGLDLPPWAGTVWAVELTLPDPAPAPAVPRFRPLPSHPGVERDLALLVPVEIPAARVVEGVEEAGGSLLREVGVFDVYAGKGVPQGYRSLAVRLRFRAPDRSLTDTEVDAAVSDVLSYLDQTLGARVRGG